MLYDGRGTGVSEKGTIDYSLETQVLDLAAVVESLDLETFMLFAPLSAGPAAISYAASHPDRVSKFILWCSYARASDYFDSQAWQALEKLMNENWDLFVQTVSHARFDSAGHDSPGLVALLKSSVTPRMMQEFTDGIREVDVTPHLEYVKPQALVLHRQGLHVGPSIEVAIRLASQIPNARLVVHQGTSVAPYQGNVESVISAIDDFLGGAEPWRPHRGNFGEPVQQMAGPLSDWEMQVLRLIADGLSNQHIADELIIATGTVKAHINNLYSKLEVKSRTQAIAMARDLNLL